MSLRLRWATALRAAGASDAAVASWHALRGAVSRHQRLLTENGIGIEVSERDRVRVNARRVGLEAPLFADEAEASFADVLGVVRRRVGEGDQAGGEEVRAVDGV